jgi:CHAT domain-containing protein
LQRLETALAISRDIGDRPGEAVTFNHLGRLYQKQGKYKVNVGDRQLAFSGLPFAAREVGNLAAIVPETKRLLDNAFSPKVTVPQMDDYTIVHLATHAAFVVGKPEDSFILFGNGDRINLKDIATLSLPHVDLVVLSACQTGLGGQLGNGEEILGFGYQIQKT